VMPAETLPLDDALGRTLREDIVADAPFPAFANSAMDGFAVRASDVAAAPVELTVLETVAAGRVATRTVGAGEAIRIMTGAAMPVGADAVVPVELTANGAGADRVLVRSAVAAREHVRPAGEDFVAGDRLVAAGAVVDAGVIAVMAATGHASADVSMVPRVAILSTGDELVSPGDAVGPGQIRDSNTHMLRAMVRAAGCEPGPCWRLMDDPDAVAAAVGRVIEHCEVIVTIGGVSAGDFDPVKQALSRLGEVELWRVGMRPGQPQAFGVVDGKLFFGLPGNPVSVMVTFLTFVRPALIAMAGGDPTARRVTARLGADYEKPTDRAHAVRCRLELDDRGWLAWPLPRQGSHVLTSMLAADGLALVPAETASLAAGDAVEVELLDRASMGR